MADSDTFCFEARATGGVSSVIPLSHLPPPGSAVFVVLGTLSTKRAVVALMLLGQDDDRKPGDLIENLQTLQIKKQ